MMEKVCKEMYGEMKLKRESEEKGKAAHFLEVDMIVKGKYIHTGLYDKRDSFGFRVVTFPTFPTNIPAAGAHGSLIAQLVRFAKVSDSLITFHKRSKLLTDRLLGQGFNRKLLQKKCVLFCERNQKLLSKYLAKQDVILKGFFS
jgi:hypothetical protein